MSRNGSGFTVETRLCSTYLETKRCVKQKTNPTMHFPHRPYASPASCRASGWLSRQQDAPGFISRFACKESYLLCDDVARGHVGFLCEREASLEQRSSPQEDTRRPRAAGGLPLAASVEGRLGGAVRHCVKGTAPRRATSFFQVLRAKRRLGSAAESMS